MKDLRPATRNFRPGPDGEGARAHRVATIGGAIALAALLCVAGAGEAADLPRDLATYVLIAQDQLVLGARGVVNGGNVGVNAYPGLFARIGDNARLADGTVLATSTAKLDAFSTIDQLFVNANQQQASAVVRGDVAPFGTVPILTYDPLPLFSASSSPADDLQVPEDAVVNLTPGSYRRLRVRRRGAAILAPGVYEVDELRVYDDASVRAAGPVEIRVRRQTNFGARVFLGPQPASFVTPDDIRIVSGARRISVGVDAVIIAKLHAPRAWFRTRNLFSLVGQIVAQRIQLHPGSTSELPICGNDRVELGEECDGGADAACPGLCESGCTCGDPFPFPTCGDGAVTRPLEECDDGNLLNADGCSSTCNIEIGRYCTYTQGGWGAKCAGTNPGCVRDQLFASRFPGGLSVGDPSGPDGAANGFTALWTSAQAIDDYLPSGGTAGALSADFVDATPAGILAAQLVAVKLDVGLVDLPSDLHLLGCVPPPLRDLTIAELVALSDEAVATGALPADVSFADLTAALAAVNLNFDNCTTNLGCLAEH